MKIPKNPVRSDIIEIELSTNSLNACAVDRVENSKNGGPYSVSKSQVNRTSTCQYRRQRFENAAVIR